MMDLHETFDLVVWLLPYVSRRAFDADRIPEHHFCPARLLDHALTLLTPEGVLLIVNHGADEAEIQRQLLHDRAVSFSELGLLESVWTPFETPRFGFLVSLVNGAAGVEGAG